MTTKDGGQVFLGQGRVTFDVLTKFVLVLLGVLLNLNYINLPISGGETKPIYIFIVLPILLALWQKRGITSGLNSRSLWVLVAIIMFTLHISYYVLMGCGSCALKRAIAYLPGLLLLVLLYRLQEEAPNALRIVIKSFIISGAIIVAYSAIFQGALGRIIDSVRELDFHLRELFLVRARDHGKVTLLDAEPSFAAFHLLTLFIYAETFRSYLNPAFNRVFPAFLLVAAIFAQSLTVLVLSIPLAIYWISRCGGGKRILVFFIIMIMMALMFVVSGDRLVNIGDDQSTNVRLVLAYSTIVAWLDSPFWGIGLGQYSINWLHYVDLDIVGVISGSFQEMMDSDDVEIQPYSMIGGVLAEMGLLGAGVLAKAYGVSWSGYGQWGRAIFACAMMMAITAYPTTLPYVYMLVFLCGYTKGGALNSMHKANT